MDGTYLRGDIRSRPSTVSCINLESWPERLGRCKVCTRCTLRFALFRPRDAPGTPTRHVRPLRLAPPRLAHLAFHPQAVFVTRRLLSTQHELPTFAGSATDVRSFGSRHSNVTRCARQHTVRVPVRNHILAGDALTVYKVV